MTEDHDRQSRPAAGPTVLSENVVRLLQATVADLSHGHAQLLDLTEAGPGRAVIAFQDAIETFVMAIAQHLGVPPAHRTLRDYPAAIKKASGRDFMHQQVLLNVNNARDSAKHSGIYPSHASARRISAQLEGLFEDNSQQFFQASLRDVRLASSIRHEETRREVASAEDAISTGDFGEGLARLQAAFQMFMNPRLTEYRRKRVIDRTLESYANKVNPGLGPELRRIHDFFEQFFNRFALVDAGINLQAYDRFMSITPIVHLPGNPDYRTVYESALSPLTATKENAAFALEFVMDVVRRGEAAIPPASPQDTYRLRTLRPVDCDVTTKTDQSKLPSVSIPAGHQIAEAWFGHGSAGDIWVWESADQRFFLPFDSCEVLEVTTRSQRLERSRRES